MAQQSPSRTINNLLDEDTLRQIFAVVITDEHDDEEHLARRWLDDLGDPLLPERPHRHFSEVASEVCRWWRLVALEAPEIWGKIRLDIHHPPERTQRWLSRARDTPLDIVLRGSDAIIPFFDQISKHLTRITDLDVDLCGLRSLSEIHYKVIQPLNRLGRPVSMRIRSPTQRPYQPGFHEGTTMVQFSISPHPVPALRQCSLESEWTLQNLRVLRLVHYHFIEGPTRQQLHAVLESSPHLEELALDCFFDCTISIVDPDQTVILPHLHTLQILSNPTFVQWLFDLIKIPPRLKSLIVDILLPRETISRVSAISTLEFLGLVSSYSVGTFNFLYELEPIRSSVFPLLEELMIHSERLPFRRLHAAALSSVREDPMLKRMNLFGAPVEVLGELCDAVEVRNSKEGLRPLHQLVSDTDLPKGFSRLQALGVQVQVLNAKEMRRVSNRFDPLS